MQAKEIDRENYRIRFVFSTNAVDRSDEVIDQAGWKLDNYLKNPVVLFGHDQSQPAVGKTIEIGISSGHLEGIVQFAYKENPMAAMLFELYAGGYMNAGSVGFLNLKWMYDEEKDILTLVENELYEYSLVNVPANPEALTKAYNDLEGKGVDKRVLEEVKRVRDEKQAEMSKRFDDLGEKVIKEHIERHEEEAPAEVTPPEETPTEEESGDGEVEKAIEVLMKASATDIKMAVDKLTNQLKEADKKGVVENTPDAQGRKYSINNINRVIRLLNSKQNGVTLH